MTDAPTPRIARFADLPNYRDQLRALGLPHAAIDLVGPREIFQIMGPSIHGINPFPIAEPSCLLSIAGAPPGNGPELHAHHSVETFFVLEGRFRVSWGEQGEHSVVLHKFDTCSVPPGLLRKFENVGDTHGYLMAVLTGRDLLSFTFPARVAARLQKIVGPLFMKLLGLGGMRFLRPSDETGEKLLIK
jgi:mannose-6-phosphate isomerase-like protein (cupin superfamily)